MQKKWRRTVIDPDTGEIYVEYTTSPPANVHMTPRMREDLRERCHRTIPVVPLWKRAVYAVQSALVWAFIGVLVLVVGAVVLLVTVVAWAFLNWFPLTVSVIHLPFYFFGTIMAVPGLIPWAWRLFMRTDDSRTWMKYEAIAAACLVFGLTLYYL